MGKGYAVTDLEVDPLRLLPPGEEKDRGAVASSLHYHVVRLPVLRIGRKLVSLGRLMPVRDGRESVEAKPSHLAQGLEDVVVSDLTDRGVGMGVGRCEVDHGFVALTKRKAIRMLTEAIQPQRKKSSICTSLLSRCGWQGTDGTTARQRTLPVPSSHATHTYPCVGGFSLPVSGCLS